MNIVNAQAIHCLSPMSLNSCFSWPPGGKVHLGPPPLSSSGVILPFPPPSQRGDRHLLCRTRHLAAGRVSLPEASGSTPFEASWAVPDWEASCGRSRGTASPSREGQTGQSSLFWQSSYLEQDTVGVGNPCVRGVFAHSALMVKVAAKHSWLPATSSLQGLPAPDSLSITMGTWLLGQRWACLRSCQHPGPTGFQAEVLSSCQTHQC